MLRSVPMCSRSQVLKSPGKIIFQSDQWLGYLCFQNWMWRKIVPKRNSSFSTVFLVPGHKHLGITVLSHHQFLAEELPMSREHLGYIHKLCFWQETQAGSLWKPEWPTKVWISHLYFRGCFPEDVCCEFPWVQWDQPSLPSSCAPAASSLVRRYKNRKDCCSCCNLGEQCDPSLGPEIKVKVGYFSSFG